MDSPLNLYKSKLDAGEIKPDLLQNEVILAFDTLYHHINTPQPAWYLKPFARKQPEPDGLYIYGTVGRGKTFLMDLFVSSIDENLILRQHFHSFMLWFHQQLHQIKNQQNPIDIVIKKLAKNIKVLCLDEFLVHDITDAMLLSGILHTLDKYHIKLITTSNINPVHLYEGGLQRKKFLPAIRWIQENMQVLQLDGQYDYRKTHNIQKRKWLYPINQESQKSFEQTFSQLVNNEQLSISAIEINKRTLHVIKRSEHHAMFEFETLCKQARSASDYIQLSKQYQSISMVINEAIADDDRNTAKRFITLIDVLYDTATPLYVLSVVDFNDIYKGQDFAFEMQRTISRLTEMQADKSNS